MSPGRLVAILVLPGFHARYLEVVLEINFAGQRIGRMHEGGIGGPSDSTLIACSLAVNIGESCVAACEARLGIIQRQGYYIERQLAVY